MNMKQLREKNKKWFSPENKRFFGDINYKVLQSKKSKTSYLIQHTYKWSDRYTWFSNEKKAVYVVKPVTNKGDILECVAEFKELSEVKNFLKNK